METVLIRVAVLKLCPDADVIRPSFPVMSQRLQCPEHRVKLKISMVKVTSCQSDGGA